MLIAFVSLTSRKWLWGCSSGNDGLCTDHNVYNSFFFFQNKSVKSTPEFFKCHPVLHRNMEDFIR